MQKLKLHGPLRVLCIGAHADDIEIGCGGTLLQLAREQPELSCDWVVFSATPQRAEEARASARRFLRGVRTCRITVLSFEDGFFPYQGAEIKRYFENLKPSQPDLIFTHYHQDRHQDHRLLSDLTWNTFRDHFILEYEIPKYDGDLGQPNSYVHLDAADCDAKIETLLSCFASQRSKHWFTADTFQALMRLRGLEAASPTRFAEGFYVRKQALSFRSAGPRAS